MSDEKSCRTCADREMMSEYNTACRECVELIHEKYRMTYKNWKPRSAGIEKMGEEKFRRSQEWLDKNKNRRMTF